MLPPEGLFTASLHRPYLDLGPAAEGGPLHAHGLESDYRSLTEDCQHPRLQGELPPSFRRLLIRATGLTTYQLRDPRELAPALRTERWQRLCEYLDRYDDLPAL